METIRDRCERRLNGLDTISDAELGKVLGKLSLSPNASLPGTADVEHYHELFSNRQLAALALLREAIDALSSRFARDGMRLAWSASASLAKLNRTFLSAEGRAESRGGSSIFSIYRYKVAARPVELSPWATFYERARNILAAKAEIDRAVAYRKQTGGFVGRFEAYPRHRGFARPHRSG